MRKAEKFSAYKRKILCAQRENYKPYFFKKVLWFLKAKHLFPVVSALL